MINDKTTIDGSVSEIVKIVRYVRQHKTVRLSEMVKKFGIGAVEICSQLDEIGVLHCPTDTVVSLAENDSFSIDEKVVFENDNNWIIYALGHTNGLCYLRHTLTGFLMKDVPIEDVKKA